MLHVLFAERKVSVNNTRPGVVFATFKSHDDKRKVMLKKKVLMSHVRFSGVYINNDLSQADRVMSSNFRTILCALKHHNLTFRGNNGGDSTRDRSDDHTRDTNERRSESWNRIGRGRNGINGRHGGYKQQNQARN